MFFRNIKAKNAHACAPWEVWPRTQGSRNQESKKKRHGKHIYGDTYNRYKKRDESYKKETMNTWLGKEMWTTFTVGGVVKAL